MLSLVSLFTDLASEMLYPLMPVYLRQIGFSFFLIGLLEGLAELTAGISKGYFGHLSDNLNKRVPFVRTGYALSAIAKPLMGLFQSAGWVLTARTMDKLGKGIRTAPRDAILSLESSKQTKGKIFGLHRSMDTVGAFLGPILALVFIQYISDDLRQIFYWSFFPGMAAILFTFFLKEKKYELRPLNKRPGFLAYLSYWKEASPEFKKPLIGFIAFAIFNSSDFFLLLRMQDLSDNPSYTITAYIIYNAVFALTAFPIGILGDRIGLKKVFLSGLLIFSFVYISLAHLNYSLLLWLVFAVYGLFAATNESISKALIAKTLPDQNIGKGMGLFVSLNSLAIFTGNIIMGSIWNQFGFYPALLFSGLGSIACVLYFLSIKTAEK